MPGGGVPRKSKQRHGTAVCHRSYVGPRVPQDGSLGFSLYTCSGVLEQQENSAAIDLPHSDHIPTSLLV